MIKIDNFGTTSIDQSVTLITITNDNGMSLSVSNYGACITSIIFKDKTGTKRDMVLGFSDALTYEKSTVYSGCCVGRNANRIKDGIAVIDGQTYLLEKNDKCLKNLHSGTKGYHRKLFDYVIDEDNMSVTFKLEDIDMSQGFPGNLEFSVTYKLGNDNAVYIDYKGISDKITVFNPTNHSYFNLSQEKDKATDIMDHELMLKSSHFLEIDELMIPTGKLIDVTDTVMDFRQPTKVGARNDIEAYEQLKLAGGYDHDFVIDIPDNGQVEHIATLSCEKTGIQMKVLTDRRNLQVYAGNFVHRDGLNGKYGYPYIQHSGICLETQFAPNMLEIENMKSSIIHPGEVAKTRTVYQFELI